MPQPQPQPQENPKPHDEYYADLHPHPEAGMNVEGVGQHPAESGTARTAYDVKSAHRHLQRYEDDDLKQIPILPRGTRLLQGATYIDLAQPHPSEFTATAQQSAGADNLYVPKADVEYQLWNRLIGVKNPERLGQADEG